jgi:hypothetical protein
MTEEQFKFITKWQKETFGKATALSKAKHLRKEIDELISAIENNESDKRLEFADVFILAFGSAASDGMSYQEICSVIDVKMAINVSRKWGNPDEDGVVLHVKEGE